MRLNTFDGFLTLDGRTLEVTHVRAKPGRPTLVFLHEGLGSVELWRDFPHLVAGELEAGVLIYSRYGNGQSDVLREPRAPSYMHEEATRVLPALLDARDVEMPVLIGHSDGASIALLYAAAFRSAVRAVVVEAPHCFVEAVSLRSIAAIREVYRSGGLRARLEPYHRDVDATFYGWNDIWLDPAFAQRNIEGETRRIDAPLLCIQGDADEYGTLAQLDALERNSRGPVERFVLAGCGHAPHRERAGPVASRIVAWLRTRLAS